MGKPEPKTYSTFGTELVRKPKKAEGLEEVVQELCDFINTRIKDYESAGVGVVKLIRCNFKDLIVAKIKAAMQEIMAENNTDTPAVKIKNICELIDEASAQNYREAFKKLRSLNFGTLGSYLGEIRSKLLNLHRDYVGLLPDKFKIDFPKSKAAYNEQVLQFNKDVEDRAACVMYVG